MFIVLAEHKDFETIKTHLIDEEGAKPQNFLYYTAVQRFNLAQSTYGTNLVAEDIPVLFTVDKRTIRDFQLSFIFNRIVGFFLAPALFTSWYMKICYLVEDRSREYVADPEIIKWYENWERLSNFVYNGGKSKVKGFTSLTLADVKNNLLILKTAQFEPETKYSPWVNPGVDENPNYNKARQVEKWKQTHGQGVAGKDFLKKSGYHSVAGIIVPGSGLASCTGQRLPVRPVPSPTIAAIPSPATSVIPSLATAAVVANPATARAPALAGGYAAFAAVIARLNPPVPVDRPVPTPIAAAVNPTPIAAAVIPNPAVARVPALVYNLTAFIVHYPVRVARPAAPLFMRLGRFLRFI